MWAYLEFLFIPLYAAKILTYLIVGPGPDFAGGVTNNLYTALSF